MNVFLVFEFKVLRKCVKVELLVCMQAFCDVCEQKIFFLKLCPIMSIISIMATLGYKYTISHALM